MIEDYDFMCRRRRTPTKKTKNKTVLSSKQTKKLFVSFIPHLCIIYISFITHLYIIYKLICILFIHVGTKCITYTS